MLFDQDFMHSLGVSITALIQGFQKIVVNEDLIVSDLRFSGLFGENRSYRFDVYLEKPGDFLFPLSALIERSNGLPDRLCFHGSSSAGFEIGQPCPAALQPEALPGHETLGNEAPLR
ncbi:hypothetical protein ES708_13696 [subsurface metagenome]